MFFRTARMLESGMKPVYIFDGKPPDAKKEELNRRFEKRGDATEDLEKAKEVLGRPLAIWRLPDLRERKHAAACVSLCQKLNIGCRNGADPERMSCRSDAACAA